MINWTDIISKKEEQISQYCINSLRCNEFSMIKLIALVGEHQSLCDECVRDYAIEEGDELFESVNGC